MSDAAARLGRYRLVRLLGRGGMGEVWEAVLEGPHGFRKPVALKVLHEDRAPGPEDRRALFHEARLGALLSHPNVVATFELGEHEGRWFVSMELVRGASLAELLGDGPLAPAQVVDVGLQVCAGLGHIHALQVDGRPAGLIHRDLKPANLLLDRTGLVRIADLGVARLGSVDARVAGTRGYMPPEQYEGREDARSDLFALGAVLFRLLTRRMPYGRADAAGPIDWTGVGPGLVEVLDRCLRLDPAERPASAHELAGALRAALPTTPPAPPLIERLARVRPDLDVEATPRPSSDAATVVMAAGNLPGRADRFVGREHEQQELSSLVRRERLVTVLGQGGTGKTRLSLEVARRLAPEHAGGAWFCDVSEAVTASGLCNAVGQALGVPLDASDPVRRLGHALAGRGRALLVLDNLEQVAGEAGPVVEAWLRLAPDATLLCTSQVALRVRGERTFGLGALEVDEAVALFRDRAARAPADDDPVRTLVERLDGLPLAVELAAARTRVLSVRAILDRLEERFRILAGGEASRPERHRSLRASLDASCELLDDWARDALAQLSMFRDGFRLDAAEAVLALPPTAPWTLDVLGTLVDHSLLRFEPAEDRFRMLQTVQAYAGTLLADPEPVRARHCAWYAQLGSPEARAALRRHGGVERRQAVVPELENLLAAAAWARDARQVELAVQASLGAFSVLALTGPMSAALAVLDRALAIAPPLPELLEARGRVLAAAGRRDEAIAAFDDALERIPDGDPSACDVSGALALVLVEIGRTDDALRLALTNLEAARASGDDRVIASALADLGGVHRVRGELELGRDRLAESLPLFRAVGDDRSLATALGRLAVCHKLLGDTPEALRVFEEAIGAHRAIGDTRGMGSVLANIAALHMDLGEYAESVRIGRHALRLHREVGNRPDEGVALGNLGLVDMVEGRYPAAHEQLGAAITICEETGNRIVEVIFRANLGGMLRLEGRLGEARSVLARCLADARELGDQRLLGFCEGELGVVAMLEGDLDEAEPLVAAAVEHLRAVGDLNELAKALTAQVELFVARGDTAAARAAFDEARRHASAVGVEPDSVLGQRLAEVGPKL